MTTDEKAADRAVASGGHTKKDAVEKKPERVRTGDATAAAGEAFKLRDASHPAPVTQPPVALGDQQHAEAEAGDKSQSLRAANEERTTGITDRNVDTTSCSVAATGQDAPPAEGDTAVATSSAFGSEPVSGSGDQAASMAPEFPLGANRIAEATQGMQGVAAVGASPAPGTPAGTAAAANVEKAGPGFEVKVKAAASETSVSAAVPTGVAPNVIAGDHTGGDHTAGQHGSPQSGETGSAVQQAVQVSSNAGVGGVSGFHAPTPSDATGSARGHALPVATPVEASESASAKTMVSTSQLIQSMHGTEMRVGMHSAEFGAISISTSISHQVLSASISLGHAGLGRALALHMPAIEEKLSNTYGLQTRVEMRESHGERGQDTPAGADQGRRTAPGQSVGKASHPAAMTSSFSVLPTSSLVANSTRLDVLY